MTGNRCGVSFWGDKSILELDDVDGSTTLGTCSNPMDCILQEKFYSMWITSQRVGEIIQEEKSAHMEGVKETTSTQNTMLEHLNRLWFEKKKRC